MITLRQIKVAWKMLKWRWTSAMPRVFKSIMIVSSFVSGLSLAIHSALSASGVEESAWFQDILPYLIGFGAGIAFISKFTVDYSKKDEDN